MHASGQAGLSSARAACRLDFGACAAFGLRRSAQVRRLDEKSDATHPLHRLTGNRRHPQLFRAGIGMSEENVWRFRKLSSQHITWVQPLVLTGIMTLVVAGISTVRVLGFNDGVFSAWMISWILSWIIAFPTMLVSLPLVRRIVASLVTLPGPK
jgi:hypothetical protein